METGSLPSARGLLQPTEVDRVERNIIIYQIADHSLLLLTSLFWKLQDLGQAR